MSDTLLLTSDLHGSLSALRMIAQRAKDHDVGTILLSGDFCPSGGPQFQELLQNLPPLVLVRGNCDTSYDFSNAGTALPPLSRTLSWGEKTILITHGDRITSVQGMHLKPGDIFLSGHTHVPKLERREDGVIWVNPGSPTYPRTALGQTYGLLDERGISIRTLQEDKPIATLQYYFLPSTDQYESSNRARGTT
ncbi:MAG: YfcE family phosphodiesterase [Sphaerochaeta sp.]